MPVATPDDTAEATLAVTEEVIDAYADLTGDIVYLSQSLDFEKPVRPGQTVTATVAVAEELGDDRLRVETVAETGVDDGGGKKDETDGEQVLSGEAVVLSLPHEG